MTLYAKRHIDISNYIISYNTLILLGNTIDLKSTFRALELAPDELRWSWDVSRTNIEFKNNAIHPQVQHRGPFAPKGSIGAVDQRTCFKNRP